MDLEHFGENSQEQSMAKKEQQAMEAQYGIERQEDYAKRDPLLTRFMEGKNVKDVACVVKLVEDYENPHAGATIDRFDYNNFKKVALARQRALEVGLGSGTIEEELIKAGIVSEDAKVSIEGYLLSGQVLVSGYSLRVDRLKIPKEAEKTDEYGNPIDGKNKGREPEYIERVSFGSKEQRTTLAKAYKEAHNLLVTCEILQNQTELTDKTRAALETAVKYFYQDQLYFTNQQNEEFWRAADILKMNPEDLKSLENRETGQKRNKAMRLYYLVGMSETTDKMLDHLNSTYNLEEILDFKRSADGTVNTETLDRVINLAKLMDEKSRKTQEKRNEGLRPGEKITVNGLGVFGLEKTSEELKMLGPAPKFEIAAKFLISKDLVISVDADGNRRYKLPTWLKTEERDPQNEKTKKKAIGNGDYRKGGGSVEDEAKEGIRGFLAELGNPYIEGSRDNLYALMNRFSMIVGNESSVTEAGRYFWSRGGRDEFGMEIYSFKNIGTEAEPKWVPNLPTGEELLAKKNELSLKDYKEWKKYCLKIQKLFAVPGEPVCTDLSKLFHTKMWRLKEMMYNRSAGPVVTYDKFDRLTQSMFSLARIRVNTGAKDEYGEDVTEYRSINEAFLGHKKDKTTGDVNEMAVDLGNIEWQQSKMPTDVQEFLAGGGVELEGKRKELTDTGEIRTKEFKIDLKAVQDNVEGYFWVMNYLAADDNVTKRPWQFIMKLFERAGDMETLPWYTDKIKFWQIIWHGAATAWGQWRGRYIDARNDPANAGKGRQELVKAAEDKLDDDAGAMVEKGKMDYFDGVRSSPAYQNSMNEPVKITVYTEKNGRQSATLSLEQVVEGRSSTNPGLAVRHGFMDPAKAMKPPKYVELDYPEL